MGHYDNEEDEWPELLPGFITVDYHGKNSEIVPTLPRQRENDARISSGSLDIVRLKEEYESRALQECVTTGYYGMANNESSLLNNSNI